GERRGAGARQSIDVDGSAHRELRNLGMYAVPGLELEPVDEPPPEGADHRVVARVAQVGVALDAVEQHGEPLTEIAGAEVGASPAPRPRAARRCSDIDSRPRPYTLRIEALRDPTKPVAPADTTRAGNRRAFRRVRDRADRRARNLLHHDLCVHTEQLAEVRG